MRKKRMMILLGAAVAVLALGGGLLWWLFSSRVIKVWVYTDYAFRYSHPEWSPVIDKRFQEVNGMYQRSGTGVQWKVLDSSQIDPTSGAPSIDSRRATMALHFDKQTDIYVVFTGVTEADRTGSVSPFTRVAVVVDYPDKSEIVNSRLLAHELAHLFGVPHDPAWNETLMNEKPESNKFSERSIAVIRKMRDYPFAQGIDGLNDSAVEKRAVAAVELDDVAAHSNAPAHAHTVLGTSFINERRMAPALEEFRAAVAADPNSLKMHLNLAEAYSRDSQWEKALAEARDGVRLAPNDALAHRALGALLGRNHQPEEALKELRIAKQLDPANSQNEVLMGLQYAGMFGHLDDAVAALQEAAREDPKSGIAQASLEKAQTLKERVEETIAKQREVVKSHPNDPDAHYRLGKAEARAGDFQNAIRDFQKVVELRPDSGTAHNELAELYLVKGDPNTAWEEIRKARELGAEPPASLLARLPQQK